MTRENFKRVIKLLEGGCLHDYTEKQKDAAWMIWRDQPDEVIIRAAGVFVKSERVKFGLPKPGELLQATTVDLDVRAELALRLVMENNDPRESVCFEDKTIHATIERMGGWAKVCSSIRELPETDWRFWAREFMSSYRLAALNPGPVAARFLGTYEINNAERWPDRVPPTRQIPCGYLAQDPPTLLSAARLLPEATSEA